MTTEFNLKNKIEVTDELLSEFITKGWQEIESLQYQIANIHDNNLNKLLNNLLTSYYVFIGELENLSDTDHTSVSSSETAAIDVKKQQENIMDMPIDCQVEPTAIKSNISHDEPGFEPFEYFVDFDDPVGVAITDMELYGN